MATDDDVLRARDEGGGSDVSAASLSGQEDENSHRTTAVHFRELRVWQKAMDLAVAVYRLAEMLPRSETYGLRAQLTRAVASVPANIAEGHARSGPREFAHFVSIARGSLAETETFLLLACRLGYIESESVRDPLVLKNEIDRMLSVLQRRLS